MDEEKWWEEKLAKNSYLRFALYIVVAPIFFTIWWAFGGLIIAVLMRLLDLSITLTNNLFSAMTMTVLLLTIISLIVEIIKDLYKKPHKKGDEQND